MPSKCFLLLLLLGLHGPAGDSSVSERHIFQTRISRRATARYLLSLPAGYADSKRRWPLILFLHGGSGRGDDIDLVSRYGPPAIAAKRPDYPFIVLSPQCPAGEIWSDADLLVSLLDDVVAHHRVDPERIYLTGMSMGGRGVWYLAYKHPDRFAAIVPVNAYAPITDWAKGLKTMPVWVFHGDRDTVVPLSDSEDMVRALRAVGNDAKFTILPGRGHDIADVYDLPELYEWMLAHRRPHP